MLREKQDTVSPVQTPAANSPGLYRLAGVGVLLSLALGLLDIGLSFGGGDVPVGTLSAREWFARYQHNWFVGLRNLGFFNVVSPLLTIPLYLALGRLHRRQAPVGATLALLVFVLGAAVYISNNRALAMLTLSREYAAAQTPAEMDQLAVAGTVMLAQAEDFTLGTLPGFVLLSAGSLGMLAVMLQGRVFGRRLALAGLAGTSGLLIFTVAVTLVPTVMRPAMLLALAGGLVMMGWDVAMALAMFRLARPPARPAVGVAVPAR